MFMRPKTRSRSFATRAAIGLAVLCLAGSSVSRAQCVSAPANSVTLQDQGVITIFPFAWAPGHSYTVTITGTYPTGPGAPTYCLGLSAWLWPDYPDYWQVGGYDPNIQISNPTWVSPTVTTFDVSVSSNAPTGKDFLELQVPGGEEFWGILIYPAPTPTQPSPPQPAPCPTPKFDPNNPVTPDTWIPGQTYNITVKGTGFTTQAGSSLPYCPATTITLSVNTGSVDLSNIVVVDSSTITATVAPAGTDPGETVNIMLWGPPEYDDDDDDQGADVAAPPSGALAEVLVQEPTIQTPLALDPVFQVSTEQFPTVFSSLSEPPTAQDATLMAAVEQPVAPWAALAAATPTPQSTPAAPNGMVLADQATAQLGKLYIIDPFLLSSASTGKILASDIISAISNKAKYASGVVADGISSGIAVFGPIAFGQEVSFSVNNYAGLNKWDPGFLTPTSPLDPTNPGSDTYVVHSSDLIQQGSNYYAIVLVTAALPQNTVVGEPITLTAVISGSDDSDPPQQQMLVYPVPIVFIHGLWSNSSALNSTKSFLQNNAAFANAPSVFLNAVCYSPYLAYYATSDPMPGAAVGTCEETSTEALNNYLNKLYSYLNKNQIVGGRVDAVAHSMGGLVVRNYYQVSQYKNLGSRSQGLFRDIITLDTPETGSPLAWYLDNVFAYKTEDPSHMAPAYTGLPVNPLDPGDQLWKLLCGYANGVTVRTCLNTAGPFASSKMPLAPPQDPDLSRGAVASLIPGDSHLVNLPNPNIPNAIWGAIASNYQEGGSSVPSTLEAFFNTFVAALYPTPVNFANQPPSDAFMMTDSSANSTTVCVKGSFGFRPNDVIVPVCSQTYESGSSGPTITFPGLVHAPILAILPHYGKAIAAQGVTQSPQVNAQICSWLGYDCDASPQASPAVTQVEEQESPKNETPEGQITEGNGSATPNARVNATLPSTPIEVGQPVQIPLQFERQDVTSISVIQRNDHETLLNALGGVAVGSGETKTVRDEGLTKTVEVTPLQVGSLDIDIVAQFTDGSFIKNSYVLNVVPSPKGLKKFYLDEGFDEIELVLDGQPKDRAEGLSPEADYDQLDYPLRITDFSQIVIKVSQPENNPIISLDENGIIHALRLGQATISGGFGGLQDSVLVKVLTLEQAAGDRIQQMSVCRQNSSSSSAATCSHGEGMGSEAQDSEQK